MSRAHQIYFLQRADGLIKIGTTTDFKQRLAALTGSHGPLLIIRIINGDVARERSLHRKFKRFHQFGEWFSDPEGALTETIKTIQDGDAIELASSKAKAEWMAGEGLFVAAAAKKANEMIKARMTRSHLKRAAAETALAEDYGFSPWFLLHLRSGKASSISGYGFQQLSRAYVTELELTIASLKAEMAQVERA